MRTNRVKLTLLLCNLGKYGLSSEWKRTHHQASCQADSFGAGMLPTLSHLPPSLGVGQLPFPPRLALERVDAFHSLSPPLLRPVHVPPGFASGPAGGVGRRGLVVGKLPSSRQLSTQREATRGRTQGEAEDLVTEHCEGRAEGSGHRAQREHHWRGTETTEVECHVLLMARYSSTQQPSPRSPPLPPRVYRAL